MATNPPENNDEVEGLFPGDANPENRVPKVSAVCSYGTRPWAMTGFLRRILLDHFAAAENIEEQEIRRRLREHGVWKPGTNTGLLIESITRWRPELTDKRPAILIARNAVQWQRLTIGDQAGAEVRDGFLHYTGAWTASHTLFAVAKGGQEADILGMEVARLMLHFGPVIMDQLDLHRFVLVGADRLHQIEGATEQYVVPVTVAYYAMEDWVLQLHAPRLKRLVFRASELLE